MPSADAPIAMSRMALEGELCPYEAQDLRGARVLVYAPHPDDETLGCGGAIALHVRSGDPVSVVILTDGAQGTSSGKSPDSNLKKKRADEAREAARILGVRSLEFWRYPDRMLFRSKDIIAQIYSQLKKYKPDLIYCPSPQELHPDHRAAAAFVIAALKKAKVPCRVAFYEVSQPLWVNTLVNITSVIERKRAAASCYRSQLHQHPYLDIALGLNRFRSLTLGPHVIYAEGFVLVSSEALTEATSAYDLIAPPYALLKGEQEELTLE